MGLAHAFGALVLCIAFVSGVYLLKRPSSDAGDRAIGLVAVLMSATGLLLLAPSALAAEAAVPASPWSGVVETAIAGFVATLSAVILAVFELLRRQLKARLGVELDDQARAYVQDAADRFADLVRARLGSRLHPAGSVSALEAAVREPTAPVTATVYDAMLDDAVDAMIEQVPDGLSRLGVDANGVRRMLQVRLAARGVIPAAAE